MAHAQTAPRNGVHGNNGTSPFQKLNLDQLREMYDRNKKPGRRSKEQQDLLDEIERREADGENGSNGKSRKGASVGEEVSMDIGLPGGKKKMGRKLIPKTDEPVSIPDIEVAVVQATVVGTEILIMHAWDVKSKRQIEEKQQKKAKTQKEARDPDAEFNAARYVNSKGLDCIPARHFKNAMVEAASFLPDVTKKLIKGAIYVKGDLLPILDAKSGKPVKATKREDMVRIGGMSKVADIRYRPQYPNWKVELEIEFDKSVFSVEQVVHLLNRAGFNVGVGEWRPTYGRFQVASGRR